MPSQRWGNARILALSDHSGHREPKASSTASLGMDRLIDCEIHRQSLNMALTNQQLHHAPGWMGQPTPLGLWMRLPVQFVLMAWAWWYTRPETAAVA